MKRSYRAVSMFLSLMLAFPMVINAQPSDKADVTREGMIQRMNLEVSHPRVWHTPAEVERARRNAEQTEWGKATLREIVDRAERLPAGFEASFVEMSEQQIRSLAPIRAPDGETYFTLPAHKYESVSNGNICPIDGTPMDISGLDEPGKMRCRKGHVFPNDEFPDDGDGWQVSDVSDEWAAATASSDQRFWFVALYNGWMAKYMAEAVEPIAYAYAVTGNQKYAGTVATLLDVLASHFHTSHGPIVDYPGRSHGRLYRPGYQVGRGLRDYTNAADLIWESGALDRPSAAEEGLSIKQNVAENMVVEGMDFIWRNMRGGVKGTDKAHYERIFHNGTADYQEGLLSGASLLGLDGIAAWTLEGQVSLDNFLANTIFRDGQYYETATMYSVEYLAWAELAYHLRNEDYPDGYDVYGNPRFINLNVHGPQRFSVAGRQPRNGDTAWPDTSVIAEPFRGEFDRVLPYYVRTDDPAKKEAYAQKLAEIADGDPNRELRGNVWALFNVEGQIEVDRSPTQESDTRPSEILPATRWVIFRPEDGHARGAALRYGSTLSHGHTDELGLQVFGAGRELAYDLGHKPKRHFMNSFLRQTVAHNTVTVNETSQVPPSDDGGDLHFFTDRRGYTVAEVSNPQAYEHEQVDTYRRTTAYVDVSAQQSYLVDVFRVDGADTADYSFHGQGIHFDTNLELSSPEQGSLASSDYCWADKQRTSGEIIGFESEPFGFNVRPGNGYGFLCNTRRSSPNGVWQATWTIDERRGRPGQLRLHMLPDPDTEVLVAEGPELLADALGLNGSENTIDYVLARHTGATPAQFVSVIEAVGQDFPVQNVSALTVNAEHAAAFQPVGLKVALQDRETTDYFVSGYGDGVYMVQDGANLQIRTDAGFAMVRIGPEGVENIRVEQATHLELKTRRQVLELDNLQADFDGTVQELDVENSTLTVEGSIQEEGGVAGRYAIVDAPEYSHNTPYKIDRVQRQDGQTVLHLHDSAMDLGRGTVASVEDGFIQSRARFPLTRTRSYYVRGTPGNEYYNGREIVNLDTGSRTRIKNTDRTYRGLAVQDASGFSPGNRFVVRDIKVGDRIRIPFSVDLERQGDHFVTRASADVKLEVRPLQRGE